ncbi:MAG: helix-turn-helix transcriptional regulator [Elusimicrobia bacterium]|nr:helix-turn-helix transcriptional regulator [Elusimicrobiota bacterium]
MNQDALRAIQREILLSFWKAHILHHASEEPVVGHWMLNELRRHGYNVSPGTLYPMLDRLRSRGWLACKSDPAAGPKSRKEYTLTPQGRKVLSLLRRKAAELYREVVLGEDDD